MAQVFGKYEVKARLAVGGMGEVFLATQSGVPGFERPAILKTLLPDLAQDPTFVQQFLDEARVAATLNHPNIVSIYEVGQWEGVWFIAMELIRGRDVSQLVRRAQVAGAQVPPEVAARIVRDAALGLAHAHAAVDAAGRPLGIVHRDISPNNLMVREDGLTKVVDFGIALAANRGVRTATGTVKGKLAYMAPEQISGKATPLSDQYSLGLVLWELLAGKRLFQADNDLQLLRLVAETKAIPPPSSVRETPRQTEAVAMRMVERDPAQRYPSCDEVAAALEPLADRGESMRRLLVALGPVPQPAEGSSLTPLRVTAPERPGASLPTTAVAVPLREQPARSPWRRLGVPVLGLAMLAAAAAGFWRFQLRREPTVAPWAEKMLQENAALAASNVERFCAESAEIASSQIFEPSPRTKDAGAFLSQLHGWSVGEREVEGTLVLPAAVENARKQGKGWEELADAARTLDFSWMKQARDFDYWTQTGGGFGQQATWPSAMEWPTPRGYQLVIWSELRFARALRDGDLGEAVADVRSLRRLCANSPWLSGVAWAAGIAHIEASAFAEAQHRGIPTGDWHPAPQERLERVRPVYKASAAFLLPGVPASVHARALECMSWSKCGAIDMATAFAADYGVGHSAETDELIAAASRAGCPDVTLLRRLQDAVPVTESEHQVRRLLKPDDVAGDARRPLFGYAATKDAGSPSDAASP